MKVVFDVQLFKIHFRLAGSYEALEAGNPADALVDFTGGVSETIDLVKGNYANDLEKRKALHRKLVKLMERKCMASSSIKVFFWINKVLIMLSSLVLFNVFMGLVAIISSFFVESKRHCSCLYKNTIL